MIRLHRCIFSLPLWNKACYQSVVLPGSNPPFSLSLQECRNETTNMHFIWIVIIRGKYVHRDDILSHFVLRDLPFFIDHVCSTVKSMLSGLETRSLGRAPGRFAPKPVPPETIPPGLFAQNFERDCLLQSSGTIRSKTNLRVDSPIFIIYMYIH